MGWERGEDQVMRVGVAWQWEDFRRVRRELKVFREIKGLGRRE